MPVLNEERYLEAAVASVLVQEVDGPAELILALGPIADHLAMIRGQLF